MDKIHALMLRLDAILMPYRKWIITGFFFLLAVFAAVRMSGSPGKIPQIKESNPLWKNFISGHTSGIISRKSNIRVEFLAEVVLSSLD